MALPTSDHFTGALLNAKWTAVSDTGDQARIQLTGSGAVQIQMPAGVSVGYQRVLNEFDGPWLYQNNALASSASDNFDITLKCNSVFTADGNSGKEQLWGLQFLNTASSPPNNEFIIFFISRESGSIRARMITNTGGTLNNTVNQAISDFAANYYLRVTRTWNSGNNSTYTLLTSPDGNTWTQRGQSAKTAAGLRPGIFAGNRGGASAVEWNPEFDFFLEASDPFPVLSAQKFTATTCWGF